MPGIISAPLSNVVAMRGPDKEKRLHGMVSDAKARKGHFGESFMHGISHAGIPYGLGRAGAVSRWGCLCREACHREEGAISLSAPSDQGTLEQ
jgi:hypothetical protein